MVMTLVNSSELAKALNVSPGRVSQYVSEGKLAGCYTGDGRARRFDLGKATVALGRQLHPGQMLGNGAETRKALTSLKLGQIDQDDDEEDVQKPVAARKPLPPRDGAPLGDRDPDRYELARTQKAEEETRRLRRMNAEAEGTFVLKAEVERQVARMLAQEVAEVEAVLRDGARRVADKLGVDFKAVRQIMMDQWRSHRAVRTEALASKADGADLSAEEMAEDI
jgi:hypothetical protein